MHRAIDLIVAGAGLLLLSPVFVIVALLVKISSRGAVFHRSVRIGLRGATFHLLKFRSMYEGAHLSGPAITSRSDPRVTTIGRFIRRTKLDELPQLINILRGEMTLVGPRPEDPRYVSLYTTEQRPILNVLPGITSAASIRYRNEEALLCGDGWERIYREKILPDKIRIDLDYQGARSICSDLRLILETMLVLFK